MYVGDEKIQSFPNVNFVFEIIHLALFLVCLQVSIVMNVKYYKCYLPTSYRDVHIWFKIHTSKQHSFKHMKDILFKAY